MARQLDIWDDRSERMPYDFPCSFDCLKLIKYSFDEDLDVSLSAVMIAAHKELLSAFPNYSIPSHWHDDVEFVAVRRGKMVYNVNGEDIPLCAGEGVFINARQLHFASSGKAFCDCEYICVQVHPSALCVTPLFKRCFVLPIIDRGPSFLFLSPTLSWQLQVLNMVFSLFELRIRREECSTSPITALSMSLSLWALLFEHLPLNSDNASVRDSDLAAMRNMVGFIQQNYSSSITLFDIASSGAMGQNKCCALFSRYFKLSPISYLNRHRLSKGAQLLRSSDKSITEIALSIGFGGASYFSLVFKKWAGVSPSEFRKSKGDSR